MGDHGLGSLETMRSIRDPLGWSILQGGGVGGGSAGGGGSGCTWLSPDAGVMVEQVTVEVESTKETVGTQAGEVVGEAGEG